MCIQGLLEYTILQLSIHIPRHTGWCFWHAIVITIHSAMSNHYSFRRVCEIAFPAFSV